jgi:hypothetical protein
VILFLSHLSFGQKSEDTWIEARAKIGFLAAHRSIMGHLPREHAYALEVSYLLQTKGRKLWHSEYKYPVYGVTAFIGTVGNQELLGNYFGAYGFVNFPFVKRKHYAFTGKLGCGLGYGTKYYDPESNVLGMAVSTPVNALISMAIENRFTFKNHSITASIDMTHFSNGATKVPNLGLNLPYVSVGYGHRIHEARDTSFSVETFEKSWNFGAMAILSVKEVFPTGGNKYPVFGLNLVARRFFRPKTGMEVSFDVISKQAIFNYHPDVPKTQAEIIQLGAFVGYLLPFHRFHLAIGMGIYVRDKFKPEDFLYHRLGMRYVFDNGLNLNLGLKSHWARADYVEYGIGYTFKK